MAGAGVADLKLGDGRTYACVCAGRTIISTTHLRIGNIVTSNKRTNGNRKVSHRRVLVSEANRPLISSQTVLMLPQFELGDAILVTNDEIIVVDYVADVD